MSNVSQYALHSAGSTGNGSSSAVEISPDSEKVALEVIVSAVGATPTATFALEGSMDGSNFVAVRTVPSDSETAASSQAYTSVGRRMLFAKLDLGAFYRFYRSTVSANTNVTYQTNLHVLDAD